jgi:protein phosphatase 1L
LRNPNFPTNPAKAFHEGFLKTDQLFCEQARNEKDKSGATATAVAILGNTITVANVGDSSAVLCKRKDGISVATKITIDHKASNEEEKKRVKETGGLVVWFGGWRVNGTLAVSRSIGDEPMSQQLIADPRI